MLCSITPAHIPWDLKKFLPTHIQELTRVAAFAYAIFFAIVFDLCPKRIDLSLESARKTMHADLCQSDENLERQKGGETVEEQP